jgi:UDP-N-acetylmuramyl pentapeptide phosphotransferase/UDP-N-acetylglucosamine-1-phosphate transferase
MTNSVPDRLVLVLVTLAAASICAVLILLLRPLLQRYALARPNARSSHTIPTPQGAGIAVIAATLVAAGICAIMLNLGVQTVLFAATIFVALVGFTDDIRPIPVMPRLLLQAVAVGAVVLAAPPDMRILAELPPFVERGMLLLAGLWFVNLVNFMDGLDLMTVAEVVPIAATLVLLGWLGDFPPLPTVIAAALGGAMLGFAPFNRPVAKVFLGDVGSLPIGLLLGFCLLHLAWQHQLIAALLLPLYYLADATLTLFSRFIKGEPFWAAHRSHFYQRATNNGLTVPQVVGEVFVLNLALAALAILSIDVSAMAVRAVLLAIGVVLVALLLYRFSGKRRR